MEEVKRPKTIKEVFKDYNSASFELNYATVVGINLYKNKSLLEHIIYTGLKSKKYSILGTNKTNGENDGSI